MVNNQTQIEAEAEKVTGADTSDEGLVVEVILEDKTPQHAPQLAPDNSQAPVRGELKEKIPWVKTSTYHHPHHPTRQQPSRWQPISYKDNNPHKTDREERRSTYYTSTQKSCHSQLPSQVSEAPVRLRVHLSIGWLDACAWYQWTTLLSRSYYFCSSHSLGRNMLRGVECYLPRGG